MGPGPSNVDARVLHALGQETIGHLDPAFVDLMDQIKSMLQSAFLTKNELTLPVSAPGSAGMETCFVNLVEPGEKVIICQNGVFGGRMRENVERIGAKAIVVEDNWGEPVDPQKLEDALQMHPDAGTVAFAHAETSTGVRSDAQELVSIAHHHNCLTIVDAVTSLGGIELKVDEWNIDAIYSGSQKCLSCIPGIAPVSFNERAIDKIRNRTSRIQSWFLDLNLVMGYWGGDVKRTYHHTAPVNSLYALHESLLMLAEEGLENSWVRHRKNHELLKEGLDDLGLALLVAEPYRLPQLNAVCLPENMDASGDARLRERLLQEFNLEIGAGLGPLAGKIWRIGLMGTTSKPENVTHCLNALRACLG